jgi:hypothetical protein
MFDHRNLPTVEAYRLAVAFPAGKAGICGRTGGAAAPGDARQLKCVEFFEMPIGVAAGTFQHAQNSAGLHRHAFRQSRNRPQHRKGCCNGPSHHPLSHTTPLYANSVSRYANTARGMLRPPRLQSLTVLSLTIPVRFQLAMQSIHPVVALPISSCGPSLRLSKGLIQFTCFSTAILLHIDFRNGEKCYNCFSRK